MSDTAIRPARVRRLLALLVGCTGPLCTLAAPESACPDLSGRYRVAGGSAPAQADLLRALQIVAQPGRDDLQLESAAGGVLTLQVLPARGPGVAPGSVRTLFRGSDFECREGRLVLKAVVPSSRQTGSAQLEGQSIVRLARSADGSLAIELNFSGSERADLYRYESARISVPRPFSGRTQDERFSWVRADRLPPPAQAEGPSADTLRDETRVRMAGLLGSGRIGFVKAAVGGMRVQLRATRGEDLVAAEDRLRAAGLPFEIEREPVWSGNGYLAEIRLPDMPGAGAGPGRPSAFRVAAELNRLLPATAHAEKVRRLGEAYVADVVLLQGGVAGLAESLPRRSTMVGRVVLLPPDTQPAPAGGRVERWLVTLKP